MMRGFFIKTGRADGYYCSKCGKYLPDDRYNIEKHATICWKRPFSESQIIKEGESRVYSLQDKYGKLCLTVSVPYVMENPPWEEERTAGILWNRILYDHYYAGGDWDKKNKQDHIEARSYIVESIKKGEIIPGTEESESEIIHRVFPEVLAVYDMRMFDYIYNNKGFHCRKALPEKIEKALLKPLSGDGFQKGETAEDHEDIVSLQAALYCYRKESHILRVVAKWKGERTVFLFSRGYAACSDLSRVEGLLEKECRMTEKAVKTAALFEKAYPEYLLSQYMQYSDNILVPLVAADYHSGMELAAKAGAAAVAENFRKLRAFDLAPSSYGNLKNLFGLPPKVLRAIGREQVTNKSIVRLRDIFEYNPELVHFDVITPSMMDYYLLADLTHCGYGNIVRATSDLTDQQNLRILRYLAGRPTDGRIYCDYLALCGILEDYVCGLVPDIPLEEACEKARGKIGEVRNKKLELKFLLKTQDRDYQSLTTCWGGESREEFEDDGFVVIAPRGTMDLYEEGKNMHNCVSVYIRSVAGGDCRIYFLREKKNINKSYGTIEVDGNREKGFSLIQARAFANRDLPIEAKRFLAKWCREKGIRIPSHGFAGLEGAA